MAQGTPYISTYCICVFYYSWVAQATDTEQSKGKWTKGDIVEFVAMLLAVPAGLGAFIILHSSGSRTDDPSHHLVTKSSVTTTISVEIATAYPEVVANDTERNQHRMAVNILDQISGNMQAQSATEDRPDRLVSWLDGTNQTDLLYPARTARSWPSRRLSYLRGDNGAKTQTSIHLNGVARAASRSRVESRVANVDPVFREEIDAHVEQERLDWAEELPLE